MIKTIKLNSDQSVELNGSMGWFLVYKETFGHDILPDIMPIIESGLTMAVNLLNGIGVDAQGRPKGDLSDLIGNIDDSLLSDLFINLSGLEAATMLQIIWSMAKNADEGIPSLREYFNQYNAFPLDVVLPKVIRLVIDSTVSAKNAKRLTSIKKAMLGLTSTKS